jgi:hypothetical protein
MKSRSPSILKRRLCSLPFQASFQDTSTVVMKSLPSIRHLRLEPSPAYGAPRNNVKTTECRRSALEDQLRTNPSLASLHRRPTRPMHKMNYAIVQPSEGLSQQPCPISKELVNMILCRLSRAKRSIRGRCTDDVLNCDRRTHVLSAAVGPNETVLPLWGEPLTVPVAAVLSL